MSSNISVHIAPEVHNFGYLSVSNSMTTMFVITILLTIVLIQSKKKFNIVPTKVQVIFEEIYEFFFGQVKQAFSDNKQAKKVLPWIITLFVVIFLANQFLLMPLVGQLVYGETSLLRTPTSDLSLPLALALATVVISNIIAFIMSPIKHVGKYFNIRPILKARSFKQLFSAFIEFFLGLLDIVGEFSKILSLTFRLFGNVISGEIIILVISGLAMFTAFVLPIPFMVLSTFSGLVQAFVFSVLALQFIAGTIPPSEDETPVLSSAN
jgi:F-type H+-transporting ATPase subunit a